MYNIFASIYMYKEVGHRNIFIFWKDDYEIVIIND